MTFWGRKCAPACQVWGSACKLRKHKHHSPPPRTARALRPVTRDLALLSAWGLPVHSLGSSSSPPYFSWLILVTVLDFLPRAPSLHLTSPSNLFLAEEGFVNQFSPSHSPPWPRAQPCPPKPRAEASCPQAIRGFAPREGQAFTLFNMASVGKTALSSLSLFP